MPQLESLFQRKPGKPRVMVYTTKDESDRASDDIFVVKGDVMYMGTLPLSQEAFPKTFRKADLAALSPDFHIRELIDDSDTSRAHAAKIRRDYREVRFIPQDLLPFEVDISIFGSRTLITSVKDEHFTIGIDSPEINRAFRSIFEVMWASANK